MWPRGHSLGHIWPFCQRLPSLRIIWDVLGAQLCQLVNDTSLCSRENDWRFSTGVWMWPSECSGLLELWCCWTDGGTGQTRKSLPRVRILWSKGWNLTSTPRAPGSSPHPQLLSDSGAPAWEDFPVFLHPLFVLLFPPTSKLPLSPPVMFGKIFAQGSVC